MGISVQEAVKEIQALETLYVAYSRVTNLPYISESEETFADQVRFYAAEEDIKAFGKKMLDDKIILLAMKFAKKDFPRMYGMIFSLGVDAVVWNNGTEEIEVELRKIVKEPDLSKLEEKKRPLINPTLQLAGAYLMQEVRRPADQNQTEEQKKERAVRIHELDEELVANLCKSEFLVVMQKDENDPKKITIPYLKNKEDKMLQPAFSDVFELEKFTRGRKMNVARVPFAKLEGLLLEQSEAMVVNPMGFNLTLNRDQLKKIAAYNKVNSN